MSGGRPSLALRAAVAVLSIVAFVSIAEILVRLTGADTTFMNRFFVLNRALDYPDVFEKDRRLFWRLRPDQTVTSRFFEGRTYHINSLGLRGEEIVDIKRRPRILALGNSCTFGWGVTDEETYVAQLESLLGGAYQVINGGIPGYSSFQGKRFFEHELASLRPDVVLICYAWNDHWAAANQIADKDQEFPPGAVIALQNLLSRFQSYRLLKKVLLATVESDPDSLFDRSRPVYRVGAEDFGQNLRAICRQAALRQAVPVLLTSPIASVHIYYPAGSRSPMHRFHERYNELIREVARAEGVGLVDLALEFDHYNDLYDDARRDPIHFNAKGHRVVAQAIALFLGEYLARGSLGQMGSR